MDKPQQGQWVVPNPQMLRTFGLLNIIFGAIIILMGAYQIVMFFLVPVLTKTVQTQVQAQLEAEKAKRDAKIADLKAREKAAKTEDEKKSLEAELTSLEARPAPPTDLFGDMSGWNIYNDRRVAIYFWISESAGILLNVAMIVAGAGLLARGEWARRLSVNVAWLKIVMWVAIVVVSMVLIVPITAEMTRNLYARMDAQMAAQRGGGAAPFRMSSFTPYVAVFTAVSTVAGAVVALIYPALSIWFLTRPRARAACLATISPLPTEPPKEQGETW